MTVAMTKFAGRHFSPDFKGTKVLGLTPDELVELANRAIAEGAVLVDGYAPFCKHLFIENNTPTRAGIAPITSDNKHLLCSGYEARRPEELAVLTRWFEGLGAPRAEYLDLILYSRVQLEQEDAGKPEIERDVPDAEWGIVSINAELQAAESPMPPITAMRNALGKDEGGSGVKLDRDAAEDFRNPWNKDRRAYGALPHLGSPEETAALLREELGYFSTHYAPKEAGAPPWRDASYAEGAIIFEAKFGKRLSEFAEEILGQYPPLADEHKGRELSLFGLSGSGKSTAIEAAKELLGSHTIIMDSDTVRFNLLAKMVKDVETADGADLNEVRQHLLHNDISGSLYFLLNHLTKELKARGYNIIRSSTMPETSADAVLYLPHPDGVDPRTVTDEQLPEVAKQLFERTQVRVHGDDDYDWEHAETVTDFNEMSNVTVQVPERVHGIFVKNLRDELSRSGVKSLKNERIDDPAARKEAYQSQLRPIIEAMERA